MTHFIVGYHISLENIATNYCNNNIFVLDVKQLNKTTKLYYFNTLKALRDGQGKIKMYYGMPRVKKQLSGKRSIGSKEIKAASQVKLLGVEMDNKLNFEHHINCICKSDLSQLSN